jgi:hypothetical protein
MEIPFVFGTLDRGALQRRVLEEHVGRMVGEHDDTLGVGDQLCIRVGSHQAFELPLLSLVLRAGYGVANALLQPASRSIRLVEKAVRTACQGAFTHCRVPITRDHQDRYVRVGADDGRQGV